jgi:hypothetical protein
MCWGNIDAQEGLKRFEHDLRLGPVADNEGKDSREYESCQRTRTRAFATVEDAHYWVREQCPFTFAKPFAIEWDRKQVPQKQGGWWAALCTALYKYAKGMAFIIAFLTYLRNIGFAAAVHS